MSRYSVIRAERGDFEALTLGTLRRIASVVGAGLETLLRWQGGDLARLISGRHSAMHEAMAGLFDSLTGWVVVHEASFSIYGERGVIDILAWHPARRCLLIVELKTELVDVNDLLATMDRRRRLATRIALERGWRPRIVATWVVVADTRTNRRRLAIHRTVLRNAFPADGRAIRGWLRDPSEPIAALLFSPEIAGSQTRRRRVSPSAAC